MIQLFDAAWKLQAFFQKRTWKSCVIGGLAVQHWGEPRFTRDIDVTLITGFGNEEAFIKAILKNFAPRIPNAEEFALKNRVLLVKTHSDIPIDISLGGMPFEKRLVDRAVNVAIGKRRFVRICSLEDLIILKAFAGRDGDWADLRGILIRNQLKKITWSMIVKNLSKLLELKEDHQTMGRLENLHNEVGTA